ncbi:YbfB/YjiJ family MFS transporter [Klebsiella pneumoniae]|uniref:YbfB/YjiJ family MFS transporter n=10 Tax=Klebsiella pneumoniae TaxID=573 RepID=UPI00132908E2|nr:YbfB/YjiJ family MFS transporter [Klebsiella pneumoniae]MXL04723.1 YbfB/YjiJ family MFS transporter [Klebsiella pneumoniae]
MPRRTATLEDVARAAGVSQQTVSRVLNRPEVVSARTREQVIRAMQALHYVPNRSAQLLAGKAAPSIGLITASLTLHAPSQIAAAIKSHASLALLAWVSSPWTIITLRAVAGALSAITLIAGSLWLLEHMGHHHGAPLLYAGVGLGIFISAEGIALGHALSLTSQQIWLLCALCAGLLLALAIRWLLTPPAALVRASHVETSLPASGSDTRRAAWRLLMVYGLAGFGYIITATYLPLFLSGSLQSVDPVHLWALFGLAAAPSCLIWHKLVLKWGYRQALTRNLLFQALGVILPACSASLLFCVLSALLVGFTFMGTVTIALPKAKSLSHQVSFNMIAAMTALYGVGQIAGPLITGALYQIAASFNPALYAAALALLIAAGLVFTERQA